MDLAPGWMTPLTADSQKALAWMQKYEKNVRTDRYAVRLEKGVWVTAKHTETMHGRDRLTEEDYIRELGRVLASM